MLSKLAHTSRFSRRSKNRSSDSSTKSVQNAEILQHNHETARQQALVAANLAYSRGNERNASVNDEKHQHAHQHATDKFGVQFSDPVPVRKQRFENGDRTMNRVSEDGLSFISTTPSSYRRLAKPVPKYGRVSMLAQRFENNEGGASSDNTHRHNPTTTSSSLLKKAQKFEKNDAGLSLHNTSLRDPTHPSSAQAKKAQKWPALDNPPSKSAVQLAREKFEQLEKAKSKNSSTPYVPREHKPFKKTVKSSSSTSFGNGILGPLQDTDQPLKQTMGLGAKTRDLSHTLKTKFSHIFTRHANPKDIVPVQQLNASRVFFKTSTDDIQQPEPAPLTSFPRFSCTSADIGSAWSKSRVTSWSDSAVDEGEPIPNRPVILHHPTPINPRAAMPKVLRSRQSSDYASEYAALIGHHPLSAESDENRQSSGEETAFYSLPSDTRSGSSGIGPLRPIAVLKRSSPARGGAAEVIVNENKGIEAAAGAVDEAEGSAADADSVYSRNASGETTIRTTPRIQSTEILRHRREHAQITDDDVEIGGRFGSATKQEAAVQPLEAILRSINIDQHPRKPSKSSMADGSRRGSTNRVRWVPDSDSDKENSLDPGAFV
ncbi:MAG: hypothetical protein M1819_004598 [Sarea resinae]|nr:MAG: hypothetical protein M1819_006799 [Sarea resinae]KAI9828273.1 MAG: hypothetical protein M1819_006611 [Sarea resinae]KAI9832054.1 MAG: hypothetical protein M1819_004598 [Sarea resinae]